jgi:hypothetical protein
MISKFRVSKRRTTADEDDTPGLVLVSASRMGDSTSKRFVPIAPPLIAALATIAWGGLFTIRNAVGVSRIVKVYYSAALDRFILTSSVYSPIRHRDVSDASREIENVDPGTRTDGTVSLSRALPWPYQL